MAMLLGTRIVQQVEPQRDSDLVFVKTTFGTVIFGAHALDSEGTLGNVHSTLHHVSMEQLDGLVRRFWKIDQFEPRSTETEEELRVEKIFLETYRRDEKGRFVVTIPLKPAVEDMGSSRAIALKRFLMKEKSLERQPALQKLYV